MSTQVLQQGATGQVKFFDSVRGFGFITFVQPDGTPEDIFVHQSAIHANGFQSLADNEPVEFNICETLISVLNYCKGDVWCEDLVKRKRFAENVTGPNGQYVIGAPRRDNGPMGQGFGHGGGPGGYGQGQGHRHRQGQGQGGGGGGTWHPQPQYNQPTYGTGGMSEGMSVGMAGGMAGAMTGGFPQQRFQPQMAAAQQQMTYGAQQPGYY